MIQEPYPDWQRTRHRKRRREPMSDDDQAWWASWLVLFVIASALCAFVLYGVPH